MQENSAEVGTYLLTELAKLRDKYEIIGDVRGKGLQIGVEMVKDKVKEANRLNQYTVTFIHVILLILLANTTDVCINDLWEPVSVTGKKNNI